MAVRLLLLVVIAVLSGASIATGAGLIYLPAGLIVGGVEGLFVVYVVAYLGARR